MKFFEKCAYLVVCVYLLILAQGCYMKEKTLEVQNIQNLKVTYPVTNTTNRMNIRGLVFSSSLGIKKITTKIEGDVMFVYVYLGIARKGVEGNLNYSIDIPESINEVKFGGKEESIWKRH